MKIEAINPTSIPNNTSNSISVVLSLI